VTRTKAQDRAEEMRMGCAIGPCGRARDFRLRIIINVLTQIT
jgi:hypothetical protein